MCEENMITRQTENALLRLAGRLALALLFLPAAVFALPEDKDQEVVVVASLGGEVSLDDGITTFRGTESQPAVITQGSMEISGLEITIEAEGGDLSKISRITAAGKPASFQQQPKIDAAIVYAKGDTIVYDDVAQLITINGSAELSQDTNILTGHLIEYEIETKKARAQSGGSDDRVNMSITPKSDESREPQ
jgi:lipopolysaccharide export system protein LptA